MFGKQSSLVGTQLLQMAVLFGQDDLRQQRRRLGCLSRLEHLVVDLTHFVTDAFGQVIHASHIDALLAVLDLAALPLRDRYDQ
jgi:hypothetical protein